MKIVKMTTTLVVETRATRSQFGENSTTGLMVHAINMLVVVAQRHKATNKMQLSINKSTGELIIVTIIRRTTTTDNVVHIVK